MARPPKINVTTNYKLFNRGEDNRRLEIHKHKALKESMKEYGFIPDYHIICVRDDKGGLVVKDGQHRLYFAQALGLPVYWTETAGDFDVAKVNSAQKGWLPADYARRFADAGDANYVEVLEFMAEHQVPLTLAAMLLAGVTTFATIGPRFYTGEYAVTDRPWAKAVIGVYAPLMRIEKRLKNRCFLLACMAVARVKGFSAKRLTECAARCRNKIVPYAGRDAYLDMLQDIYNFGRKDIVALKIEAIKAMRGRNPAERGKVDDADRTT
jgi:hypothetical protein